MALACLFDRRQVGLRDCPSGPILSAARQNVCQPIGRLVGQCPPCVHEGVTTNCGTGVVANAAEQVLTTQSLLIPLASLNIKLVDCLSSGVASPAKRSPPEQVTLQASTQELVEFAWCLLILSL
jgi:hypothetical protein